ATAAASPRRPCACWRAPTRWPASSRARPAGAFRTETGTSFARWVASVRAQHAVQLLSQGFEVDVVADAVGYRSASAFGAAFRRTTGTTPGRFRAG
ncbi:helix-turn-helix transcriptional regulator, partial [Streptomyces sp. NPDC005047]